MEVRFTGTVTSAPHFFYGTHTQAEHEQFDVRTDAGNPVRIIDNVALAPRVPVRPGDRVTVQGEEVHDPGQPPIVHWTHHDPAGIHPDGFIETGGRVYA
jgi:hypothetical protein